MAKVPFSKLQASINNKIVNANYTNKSGDTISYEVKTYLPFKEKLELVSNIINNSVDTNGFYNPMKIKMYMALEIVYSYTNLSFTDKVKEDPCKLYDILISTNIYEDIINCIAKSDIVEIETCVWETIKNIYSYKNSALGILEIITQDYDALDFDASAIQEKIADPENIALLKDVLNKLG